jgi:uridine kinase
MPGNMGRLDLLHEVAAMIPEPRGESCVLVGIDGRDGSGKTMFADELAACCRQILPHDNVVRICIDDFHHPRAIRYSRGRESPEGYWLDSYDYDRFRQFVVDPLKQGGSRLYRRRSHDLGSDALLNDEPWHTAAPRSIVIIDGIFLHRQELADAWDFSVFLDVDPEVCSDRMVVRDGINLKLKDTNRYQGGQKLYLSACNPKRKATIVIENSELERPVIVTQE